MAALPSRYNALIPEPPSQADHMGAMPKSNDQWEVSWPGGRALRSHCANLRLVIASVLVHGAMVYCTIGCVFVFRFPPSPSPSLPRSLPSRGKKCSRQEGKGVGRGLCVLLISYLSTFTLFSHNNPLPTYPQPPFVPAGGPPFRDLSIVSLGLEYRTLAHGRVDYFFV